MGGLAVRGQPLGNSITAVSEEFAILSDERRYTVRPARRAVSARPARESCTRCSLLENPNRSSHPDILGKVTVRIRPTTASATTSSISVKPLSARGQVADRIAARFARRAEAVERDRIQVAAGGAVLVGASPRIQRQLAFEVRPVPAQPQLRVGRRPNQKVEAFFGRGISSDIEAHRIRRGFMHAYLRLRGDNPYT